MLAVVGGLNHFAIRRLAQTWSKTDKGLKEVRTVYHITSSVINFIGPEAWTTQLPNFSFSCGTQGKGTVREEGEDL